MADTTERRIIEVLGRFDQNIAKQLNEIDKSLGNIKKQLKSLQDLGVGILGSVIGVNFLTTLQRIADEQISLRRSLAATIPVGQDLVETQQELFDISVRTQQSLAAVTGLYTRLTIAISDVNVNQSALTKTVEAFGSTMVIAGTQVREAAAATTQFGQALASGRLQGDEFRSLMENVPVLARVLSENLETANGKFGVTIGELRELSKAGELTTERVIAAVNRGFDDLTKTVASLPKTVGAAFQNLSDAFASLVGDADQMYGVSQLLASGLTFLTKVLKDFSDVLATIAGPAVIGLATASLGALLLVVISLGAPLIAVIGSFGALGTAMTVGAGVAAALGTALYQIADALGLLGAANITLDQALGVKSEKETIDKLESVRSKVEELVEQQQVLLETRARVSGKLENSTPGSAKADLYAAKLAETNKLIEENVAELNKQTNVYEVLNDKQQEFIDGVDETKKAYKAAAVEREKFNAAAEERRGEIADLIQLNSALGVSKKAYEAVKLQQELGEKIAKDYSEAIENGVTANESNRAMLRALSEEQFRLNEQLEKSLKVKDELASIEEGVKSDANALDNQIALGEALNVSAQAYEELESRQKAQLEVEKELSKLTELGVTLSDDQKALMIDIRVLTDKQTAANEKKLAGLKNIAKFEQDVKKTEQQIANQRALNDALQQSAKVYEEVKLAQEGRAEIEQAINDAIEAGLPLTAEQIANYTALIQTLGQLQAAEERLKEQQAAFKELNDTSKEDDLKLTNLREQIAAASQSEQVLKDTIAAQEDAATLEERKNAALKAGTTDLASYAMAQSERIANERQLNGLLEEQNAITAGRKAATESVVDLSQQTQALQAQVGAYKVSEKAGEAQERQQTAIAKAQEVVNQLSEKDSATRERIGEQVYNEVLLQEKLKQQIKDIAEGRQKAAQDAAKAERERLAAIEKEAKLKAQLEEKTQRFFEGPVTTLRLNKEGAQAELEQARAGSELQRRIAKDRYDDEKKFQDFKLAAMKAGQNLSEEYLNSVKQELEQTSAITRELEKQLELNKYIDNVKEAADPTKKLREEKATLITGLDTGVFVTEEEKTEAVNRLAAIEEQMSGLKRTAEELSSMGSPYASLVNAAAELEFVTSKAFENLNPSEKLQQGGEAALAVIAGVNDALALMGVENFEIQKGLAIATATINAALAITKVLSQGGAFAIPLAAAIGALAGVQIALIAAQEPPARALGGPVGAGSLYRVGERGPEMLQSLSGKNYMIPGEGGNVVPANQNGGVIINNLGPPITAATSRNENGDQVITIDAAVKASEKKFEDSMAKGYGGYSRAIRKNTNSGRRIA